MVRNPRPNRYPSNVSRYVYRKPDWVDDYIDRHKPYINLTSILKCDESTIGKIRNRNKFINADILERMAMDAGKELPDEVYLIGATPLD
jgi:hypothetical protein